MKPISFQNFCLQISKCKISTSLTQLNTQHWVFILSLKKMHHI